MMAPKHKVTVSVRPTARRPSSAERREAQIAILSTEQAKLKAEAAERRRTRGLAEDREAASTPPKIDGVREDHGQS
jgi:hypothetical protein